MHYEKKYEAMRVKRAENANTSIAMKNSPFRGDVWICPTILP